MNALDIRHSFVFSLLLSILGMLVLSTCSSYQSQTQSVKRHNQVVPRDANVLEPESEKMYSISLADMLRRLPGVNVTGNGFNASVTIRGISSINLTNEPLYVIDGVPVGHNFSSVASTINPQEIKYIRVLKGGDATIYGVRGSNGVIVITRK